MKRNQLIANSAVFVFFLFMFIHAFKLHEIRRFGEVGSGFWPLLVLFLAILLSLILLIKEWRSKSQAVEESEVEKGPSLAGKKRVVLSIVCLLFYVAAMPFIGFILSTLLFIYPFVLALGERRRWILVISPPLVTALTVLVFAKFIAMPLPKGVGFFAAFSRLFY
jgi:putative tricarboxylic transport membrane protein